MLERLAGNEYYCFIDGFSGYFQIPIDLKDQEKTTFAYPCGMFAYCRMPFGLCNALGTFQRCMMAIFHHMIKKNDGSLYGRLLEGIVLGHKISKNGIEVDMAKVDVIAMLPHPTTVREKSYFMVKEGIVLVHKISKNGIEVDMAKVDVIGMLPHPTTVRSSDGVFTARKPLTFSRLATMDPPRDTMARITPPKRCLTLDFIGSQSIVMPTTWSNLVTLVNVRERFGNKMKCLKIPSKFAKFLTFEESISWGRPRLYEGTKKTKRLHDSKIKDHVFNVGDRVLLFNYRLKIFSGQLKTCWSGPFTITQVFPYGTVELSQTDRPNFKVNGHRVKHYFREDIPKMVVSDLQTFPKDQ
nr:reverse transcriptase domain-containing protein [Tanacetum cinerariifolium]